MTELTPGQQLRKLRHQSKLTQSHIAQLTGYTLSTIQKWESGKHKVPQCVIELLRYKLDRIRADKLL